MVGSLDLKPRIQDSRQRFCAIDKHNYFYGNGAARGTGRPPSHQEDKSGSPCRVQHGQGVRQREIRRVVVEERRWEQRV